MRPRTGQSLIDSNRTICMNTEHIRNSGRSRTTPGIKVDKARSFRKNLSEAIDLEVRNVFSIIRSLWIPACIVGLGECVGLAFMGRAVAVEVICAVVVLYGLAAMGQGVWTMADSHLNAGTRLIARLQLRDSSRTLSLRAAGVACVMLLFSAIVAAVTMAALHFVKAAWAAWTIIVVVSVLLSTPASLLMAELFSRNTGIAGSIRRGFCLSPKYFGSTLALNFLTLLLIGLLAVVFFTPIHVLQLAELYSMEAVLYGDSTDLPGWVPIVRLLLCFVWGWLCAIFSTLWWMAIYLHIHSMNKKEAEAATKKG